MVLNKYRVKALQHIVRLKFYMHLLYFIIYCVDEFIRFCLIRYKVIKENNIFMWPFYLVWICYYCMNIDIISWVKIKLYYYIDNIVIKRNNYLSTIVFYLLLIPATVVRDTNWHVQNLLFIINNWMLIM